MATHTPVPIPRHIGFILDGNRRWARARKLPTVMGHHRGYKAIKEIARAAFRKGVKYVSVFAFSTENWKREASEVSYIMELTYQVATKDLKELHNENIKVLWLGRPDKISKRLREAFTKAVELTKNNTGGVLCICFNYGGHQEIADACRKLIEDGVKASEVTPDEIQKRLYSPEVPPVDLMVRTSGEQRISNFMLWRIFYAELLFVEKHWPAFKEADLDDALAVFANRQRRFGGS